MTLPTLRERLEKLAAHSTARFEAAAAIEDMNSEDREHLEYLRGEWNESARLAPVIAALIDAAEALEAFRSWHVAYKDSPNDNANKALAKLEKLVGGA